MLCELTEAPSPVGASVSSSVKWTRLLRPWCLHKFTLGRSAGRQQGLPGPLTAPKPRGPVTCECWTYPHPQMAALHHTASAPVQSWQEAGALCLPSAGRSPLSSHVQQAPFCSKGRPGVEGVSGWRPPPFPDSVPSFCQCWAHVTSQTEGSWVGRQMGGGCFRPPIRTLAGCSSALICRVLLAVHPAALFPEEWSEALGPRAQGPAALNSTREPGDLEKVSDCRPP